MKFKQILIKLLAFTFIVAALIYGVQHFFPEVLKDNTIWAAFDFYVGLTLIILWMAREGLKGSNKSFLKVVYGGMMMRLFFSILFLVIYLIFNEVRDKPFIIGFLILYLLFTMFEIYTLVVNLRPDLKQ